MSLELDGVGDCLYSAAGVGWSSYPLTIAFWAKPSTVATDKTMVAVGAASDLNFVWCDQNTSALRMLNRYAGVDATPSIAAAIAAGSWQPFIFVAQSATSKYVFDGATMSVVNTTNNGAFPTLTRFGIGCGIRNAGPERFFAGSIASVATFALAADQAFADAFAAGTDPAKLGANHRWKLETNSIDDIGGWTLGDVGTPTYNAADNPPINYNTASGIAIPIVKSVSLATIMKIDERRI